MRFEAAENVLIIIINKKEKKKKKLTKYKQVFSLGLSPELSKLPQEVNLTLI